MFKVPHIGKVIKFSFPLLLLLLNACQGSSSSEQKAIHKSQYAIDLANSWCLCIYNSKNINVDTAIERCEFLLMEQNRTFKLYKENRDAMESISGRENFEEDYNKDYYDSIENILIKSGIPQDKKVMDSILDFGDNVATHFLSNCLYIR